MRKYSYEFKKKVVEDYQRGEGGYIVLGRKYGIDRTLIRQWVRSYNANGDKGLLCSQEKSKYTFEYKLHVVELYLSNQVSYLDLAISLGINNSSVIRRWVNAFRIAGPDALRPKKKGRKKTLDPLQNKNKISSMKTDTSAEYVKQLEDELLKLRIENAYLKELRRLRLEEEALLKKRRESSAVSEESSN